MFLCEVSPPGGALSKSHSQHTSKMVLRFLRRQNRNGETHSLVSELYTHWCASTAHMPRYDDIGTPL